MNFILIFNKLGRGHFGTVRTAKIRASCDKKFAVKTIDKERAKDPTYASEQEWEILKRIDHPNIIRFYETYEDDKFCHIITDYCTGGDLLDRVISKGSINEQECSLIMEKLFGAVKYLHEHGIMHRDIKPENCLFSDESETAEIKLIDFGLSSKFVPGQKFHTAVGTMSYVAPEVLKGSYDYRCDYWSLGVMMYVLLSGAPPFGGKSNEEIYSKILKGKLSFEGKEWEKISLKAKDLIQKLLESDPNKRYTAMMALEHPWIKDTIHPAVDRKDTIQVLNNLRKFTAKKRFSREILNVIVNLTNEEEIRRLREVFQYLDTDKCGAISIKDLEKATRECGFSFTTQELENMRSALQGMPHDCINYTEFIIGAMDRNLCTKAKLWTAFKHFSCENKEYITSENLAKALMRSRGNISLKEIELMIAEADTKNIGKITFEEFCKMIFQDLGLGEVMSPGVRPVEMN